MAAGMTTLKGLVVGGRKTLSLGRVAFWLVFGLAVYFWLGRPVEAFPPSLEMALGFVLAYNLGSKGINAFGRRGRPPEMGDRDDER